MAEHFTAAEHLERPPKRSKNDSSSSGDLTSIHAKIISAFSNSRADFFFGGILQFWTPITIDGRRLLSTVGQPFALGETGGGAHKYRLRSVEYMYNIDVNVNKKQLDINEQVKPPMIINGAPAATAFLNRFPLLVHIDKGSPLTSYALECGLMTSFMLPVCWPSQNSSCCIGVVECSVASVGSFRFVIPKCLVKELQYVGLGAFQVQEHIPYQIITGLKPAKAEIEEVLKIVCKSNDIALALVWIPLVDDKHVSFSSYLKGTREKQMLSLKLTGYVAHTDLRPCCDEYIGVCDMYPLEMGKDFVDKTLEDYKPRFCNDVSKLSCDTLLKELFAFDEVRRLAICLNSIHTGDFCYAFEFIWWHNRDSDDVKFAEELLLKLKELLPSFKLASGAELGDELDFIKVGDSTATETKFLKIFQGKRLSPIPEVLEEGTRIPVPMVADCIAPLEMKYKTTPIPLLREVIEQQFGNTETEATENHKVSRSTLRCKCRKLGILKWKGRNKRKVNDLYSNQSGTNEEDTGIIQEPLPVNRNEHTLTIKAEYAGDMIKFHLHISQATFETVMEEIGTRFKLTPGTYKVKYLDEDKDWILLTSEQEMSDCIKTSRNSDQTAVRLHVEPSTSSISGPTD